MDSGRKSTRYVEEPKFYMYANKHENQTARDCYQAAIELDPNFATAYAMLRLNTCFRRYEPVE